MGKAGRPTKVTKIVAQKLIESAKMGMTVTEACLLVDISTTTFYTYCDSHPSFRTEFNFYKDYLGARAKYNIAKQISKGDIKTTQWWLEHKSKEFSPKQEVNMVADVKTINPFANLTEAELRKLAGSDG